MGVEVSFGAMMFIIIVPPSIILILSLKLLARNQEIDACKAEIARLLHRARAQTASKDTGGMG